MYHFTSDPGHGWLHVKREEIIRLGIGDKISAFSYQHGGMVYLEEDMDVTTFIEAKQRHNEPFDFEHVNFANVKHTAIRSYETYQATAVDIYGTPEDKLLDKHRALFISGRVFPK